MNQLLIKGGAVIDGSGAPRQRADIRVRGGRIAEIGPGLAGQGEPVIDANGACVTPGFIDSHTHLDATLFWDPMCDPMPQRGVTTVVVGNCSLGFGPVKPRDRELQADVFSYLEDIPLEALKASIPWNWETFGGYAQALSQKKLGVNIAALVGHSQLRSYVMGDAAWERAATPGEITRIADELDRALSAGAFGMSLSLFDKDRHGRWVPSHYADDAEMDALFAKLAARKGVFQFIPCNDSFDTVVQGLEWVGGFLARYGIVGLYNLIYHRAHDPQRSDLLIACLEKLHARGARMYAMVTPRPFENAVGFDQTICFIGVPAWNEVIQADRPKKRALLVDPVWRERARVDFDNSTLGMFPSHRLHAITIASVAQPALKAWVGRSLQDLVDERGGHGSDVLADWVLENDIDTSLIIPVGNTDPSGIAPLLDNPVTFISASDAGAHVQMFSGAGDTTLLLTRYVRERQDLSLERAIHLITGRQADLLGLHDRGRLRPGLAADLAIFALDELHYGPEITVHDLPGQRPRFSREPGGYRYTIVNGAVVQASGVATGALPGGRLDATL